MWYNVIVKKQYRKDFCTMINYTTLNHKMKRGILKYSENRSFLHKKVAHKSTKPYIEKALKRCYN